MATYVNDLRLKEIATGDEAGTWGTSTNTNLELIAEAFSYGTEASFGSDADATTTIADGSTDPARSLYLKVTSGASLTATRTLTIAPNTVSKVWIIENATSGSQSINISQGSGANVTIPSGKTKIVYSDGAGSGAAVVDALASLNLETSGIIETSSSIQTPLIEYTDGDDAMTIADGGQVTFAQNIIGTLGTAAQTNITSVGALNGGSITSGFGSIDVGSSAITTTGTVTGNTLAGTLSTAAQPNITSLGTLSALVIDDITINGSNITDSGDIYIDVGGDIHLDADGADIRLKDAGAEWGRLVNNSSNFLLLAPVADKDIMFNGVDGSSEITALYLDMSDAGTAIFNHDIKLPDSGQAIFGADSDLSIYHDNSTGNIVNNTGVLNITNNDIRFKTSGAETMLRAIANGAVKLMYDNSTKIETTSTGIDVTGTANTDDCKIYMKEDANNGAFIKYDGATNAGELGGLTSSGENTVMTWSRAASEVVFNEESYDMDFRVESNNNANMLFVDGGNDVVCIGGTTVESGDHFEVLSRDTTTNLRIRNTNSGSAAPAIIFDKASGSPADNDEVGLLNFVGQDSSNNAEVYAQIVGLAADVTAGTEDGKLTLGTAVSGSFNTTMSITNGNVGIGVSSAADEKLHIKDGDLKIEHDTHPRIHLVDVGNSTSEIGVSGRGAGTDGIYISGYAAVAANTYDFKITGSDGSIQTRSTIYPATGIQLGSSASSNLLDDYEEGTWTPGTGPGSSQGYAFRSGHYTKVGRLVTAHFGLKHNAGSFTSGEANITGLPFAVISTGSFQEPMIILSTIGNAPTSVGGSGGSGALIPGEASFYLAGGESQGRGRKFTTNADTVMDANEIFDSDSFIKGTVIYYTS